MKDLIQVWGRLAGRTYTAVNTNNNTRDVGEDCAELAQRHIRGRQAKTKRSVLSVALVGLLGIASGFFVLFVNPYDVLFKLKCVLGEGGEIFEMWRKPPVDLYLRVFLFNITNKDEFLAGKEKMKIQEVGPYVYKELLSHENITFNSNGTLSAVPTHPLVWVPELSEGRKEDDQLILPNIALLSIAHVVRDSSYFTRLGLNLLIRQTDAEPLVQMSAREFMMGYKSSLLTLGNKFMPNWISFDALGLIDRMYDFEGDYETIYTGENDVSKSGLLETYRGSTDLPQWNKPHCSNINGASDGTKFPSYIKPNDTLLFFRKSMCRPQRLVRVNSTVRSNLDAYYYTFAPNAMDNGYYDPDNKCFCREDKCLPSGLLDVTDCYYGFPIALSYPHFLYSDPSLLNGVEGSKPDVSKHETYFIIQPESGLPLDLAVRFQINMALGDIGGISRTERFSNMVLPMLWTEIRMYTLPEFLAARFNLYLNVLPAVETVMMYLLFISGLAFISLALFRLHQIKSTWTSHNKIGTQWLDDEMNTEKNTDFLRVESRRKMSSKELEVYYSSLITPINQDLTFEEFQEMKEELV